SDVARVDADPGGEPVKVRPETMALLERSVASCKATGRAFDPTFFALSPLYDLRDPEKFVPPTDAAIAAVLPLVDCRKIELDPKRGTVRLAKKGMGLHLGGNAKGTSLDEAARVLEAAGITRYVVDGGGDITCRGEGPKGPWRVGIQNPRGPRGETLGVVRSTGGGVATSGDYERFVVIDGVRYHHIVDPRTGKSASGCMSATVSVPEGPHAGEIADTWATTMCVLGPDKGFPLLAKHVPGAVAAIITPDGQVHRSPGFDAEVRGLEARAPEVHHAP
ncbi:MAG: FAD:protein FMN transferase, partial [Myxococcales bacterium]|nr:FAD:protein FMN transferase [Myxococcales bacterium]